MNSKSRYLGHTPFSVLPLILHILVTLVVVSLKFVASPVEIQTGSQNLKAGHVT